MYRLPPAGDNQTPDRSTGTNTDLEYEKRAVRRLRENVFRTFRTTRKDPLDRHGPQSTLVSFSGLSEIWSYYANAGRY